MHTTIRRVIATAFTLAALGAAPAAMIATASTGTSAGGVKSLGGTGSPDVFLHT